MKVLILISAVILACQAVSDEDVLKQWTEFQEKFEKTYKSPLESRTRFSIFKKNLQTIEAHNELYEKGEETYKQGLTPFTDWTPEEFLQYVNKYKMPVKKSAPLFDTENIEVADSMDWRQRGAVSEVKNQGQCGSCWSFSATGGLEGAAFTSRGQRLSLSEQNLIDCSGQYGEAGCNGGNMEGAFQYAQAYGLASESSYPYEGVQRQCRSRGAVLRATGYRNVAQSENSLKSVVGSAGPVSVAIEATGNLQNYVSGVLYDRSCTNSLNHGVLAVGYGTENGQDYWLVKNSWGAGWGEAGYFKLARNRGNNCGIALDASIPSV